ncbi:hypothetical protein SK128_027392 [Halocaridina rubra]|uniref:Uncharacterized protein n=1 Tax=Halocaridina rubra TaxID=373956 RepID=A0AAN9AAC0_HALRR
MDGKIFYTPDNAVTAKIIAEANKTFEGVHKNQLVLKSLQELSSSMSTSQNNSDLQMLEDTLRLPWLEGMMQQLFPSPDMKVAFAKQIKQSSPGLKEIANMSKARQYYFVQYFI